MICPGPRPKLRGSNVSADVGLGSSRPYAIAMMPGRFGFVAMPGRALNCEVLNGSLPLVISNGAPDCTMK